MADFTWPIITIGILSLMILIAALVCWFLWKTLRDKKSGFAVDDERTQKLTWKAGFISMILCQYFILAYLWVDFIGRVFFGMPEIEAGYPLIATVLVSCGSFVVLRWIFGRKGEP